MSYSTISNRVRALLIGFFFFFPNKHKPPVLPFSCRSKRKHESQVQNKKEGREVWKDVCHFAAAYDRASNFSDQSLYVLV